MLALAARGLTQRVGRLSAQLRVAAVRLQLLVGKAVPDRMLTVTPRRAAS